MELSGRRRFGLFMAGIGVGMSAIAMLTETLDTVFIVSSTILVIAGLIAWFSG